MTDERVREYARVIVESCLDVQEGWQVVVQATPLARPLIEEISGALARRGAYELLRLSYGGAGTNLPWLLEAADATLAQPAPIQRYEFEHADALVTIEAPENTREASNVAPERLALLQASMRPLVERIMTNDLRWIGCQYPTPALAQDAGMSLREFEDLLLDACTVDWTSERKRLRRLADRFQAGSQVRIVGPGTDLTVSVAERAWEVDAGGTSANLPGGEFFTSPIEDSAEGTIAFSEFPGVYEGRDVTDIKLRFEQGTVVDATAATNEEFLHKQLGLDQGARRLGELGIGCNPRITRHMRNTLFDEKIDGTIHLALGQGLPQLGGVNESHIHWDLVKDLRHGGRIEIDDECVQLDGKWLV